MLCNFLVISKVLVILALNQLIKTYETPSFNDPGDLHAVRGADPIRQCAA